MYQTGGTIRDALEKIQRHDLVLPAIQREFVWQPGQICRLFDSLMQGYPFGTFLYWQVKPENSDKFQFYDFVREYHQRDAPHCPTLPVMVNRSLTAVLDGQQRLTALNIGLCGKMAWKRPRWWWNNPHAFPDRSLYLDLLWGSSQDDEDGLGYRFQFLTDDQLGMSAEGECWFPVGDILQMRDMSSMMQWLSKNVSSEMDEASKTLGTLYEVVHNKPLVAYYEEHSQELEKVLQIFIRTNSGGTILSYSDLLLSVAVAQWTDHDAREEINTLVDELNGTGNGFTFSKDLVLKAGLMLSDIGSVGFKVGNFNRENMAVFEEKWEAIKNTLMLTVQLVSNFGFNGQNLRADNSILPIAYYLHMKNPGDSYLTHSRFEQDRGKIREWLVRSLLKSGIWGSGLDTLLTALRQVIRNNPIEVFPMAEIRAEMARRGRSLAFEDEEVEDLADMQYGNRLTFALLSLLFPFVDLRNQFHLDHVFPRARLTQQSLLKACVPDEEIDDFLSRRHGLANLQLLEGPLNTEKSSKMPSKWLAQTYSNPLQRKAYEERHTLGEIPESITEFVDFYEARRARLKSQIEKLLS